MIVLLLDWLPLLALWLASMPLGNVIGCCCGGDCIIDDDPFGDGWVENCFSIAVPSQIDVTLPDDWSGSGGNHCDGGECSGLGGNTYTLTNNTSHANAGWASTGQGCSANNGAARPYKWIYEDTFCSSPCLGGETVKLSIQFALLCEGVTLQCSSLLPVGAANKCKAALFVALYTGSDAFPTEQTASFNLTGISMGADGSTVWTLAPFDDFDHFACGNLCTYTPNGNATATPH